MKAYLRTLTGDRVTLTIALAFAAFQLLGIGWDLPTSFGWENDAMAPRDLFGGLAFNLIPGQGHRYPLFHYVLVGLLSLPVLIPAALTAPELSAASLQTAMLTPFAMTGVAVVARLVSVAMATASVLIVARIVRRGANARASQLAAIALATCVSFTFYGRTANLDGPYLFWSLLAADRLLDVLERGAFRDYALFAGFVGASVATKDQGYGAWVLTGPLYLVVLPLIRPVAAGKAHWKRLGGALGVGALSLATLGGALWNPTGFVARLGMLTGTNSQDWRLYERSLTGVMANLSDIGVALPEYFWPWPVLVLALLGIGVAVARGPRPERLLLLCLGVSSLLTFTLIVARSEHRFVLPLGVALTAYVGLSADALLTLKARVPRGLAAAGLAFLALWCFAGSAELLLTQWNDPRHRVQAWTAQLPAGTQLETYGLTVYQPRFDPDASYVAARIGPTAPEKRNPLVEVREIQDPYMNYTQRRPDVMILPLAFADRFLGDGQGAVRGSLGDPADDARAFFRAAFADELPGYRHFAWVGTELPGWATWLGAEPVGIQSTTDRPLLVLVRDGFDAPEMP